MNCNDKSFSAWLISQFHTTITITTLILLYVNVSVCYHICRLVDQFSGFLCLISLSDNQFRYLHLPFVVWDRCDLASCSGLLIFRKGTYHYDLKVGFITQYEGAGTDDYICSCEYDRRGSLKSEIFLSFRFHAWEYNIKILLHAVRVLFQLTLGYLLDAYDFCDNNFI